MMTNKLKYLYAVIFVIGFNSSVFAAIETDTDDDSGGTPVPAPAPPPRPGDAEGGFATPIDMHTSALLVAGVGLIASYAYFARRRKEHI